ncbi:MAG: hypothetical protein GY865_00750, partial [candidate division Zixibacteria bacterium]|nr:hypothetical protein [candidate division Zixibacteria bacterium]
MAKYLILLISLLIFSGLTFAETVQITTNGGYHPRFSPDDSKIAFTNSWNDEPNLFVVDIDGSNETHIETGLSGDYHLSWHPDGTRIFFDAFQPGTYNYNIYSIPIAGGTPTKLQVSPDGNEIAPYCALDGSKVSYMKYYGGSGYAYTSVNGGAEETIFTTTMSIGWQSLSADGNVLAFCAAEGDWTDNNFDIYTVP